MAVENEVTEDQDKNLPSCQPLGKVLLRIAVQQDKAVTDSHSPPEIDYKTSYLKILQRPMRSESTCSKPLLPNFQRVRFN